MSTAQVLTLASLLVPHDPVVLEAGGHYGEDTVQMARHWPGGKIFSFEPNPSSYEKLKEATEPYPHVLTEQLALGTHNGIETLYLCDDNDGSSSLLEPIDQMRSFLAGEKIEVPCVILDDWSKKNGVKGIDFMWLDMEGFELSMLKSSPEMLSTVRVIYTETNHYPYRKGTVLFQDLDNFLTTLGFEMASHDFIEHVQGNALYVKQGK